MISLWINKELESENQKNFSSEIVLIKKECENGKFNKEIKLSINEIGFNNTANIYSISESSKFGGKLGWVKKTVCQR